MQTVTREPGEPFFSVENHPTRRPSFAVGGLIGPPLFGVLADATGPGIAITAALGSALTALAFSIRIPTETPEPARNADTLTNPATPR